jgi:hypothetical protein
MPDLLVQLDAGVAIRGTVVKDGTGGREVFSAHDFIMVVCQIRRHHATALWLHLKRAFETESLL